MIHVGRLSPNEQWDQSMLDALFTNRLYLTGLEFQHHTGYPNIDDDGCCLIVPGRYWVERGNQISESLSRYPWVLLIRSGDEEDTFDVTDRIVHPNIKYWIQYPRPDVKHFGDARSWPCGFSPHFNTLPDTAPDKTLDVFLSAQNNHTRRSECFAALGFGLEERPVKPWKSGDITATPGFTQGIEPAEYVSLMLSAKVAPCPSGSFTPDSFRVYEALESHAIPVADDVSPQYDSTGFWAQLFPDAPFPVLRDYNSLTGYVGDVLEGWPANANRVAAWWMRTKRQYAMRLIEDLKSLGAI